LDKWNMRIANQEDYWISRRTLHTSSWCRCQSLPTRHHTVLRSYFRDIFVDRRHDYDRSFTTGRLLGWHELLHKFEQHQKTRYLWSLFIIDNWRRSQRHSKSTESSQVVVRKSRHKECHVPSRCPFSCVFALFSINNERSSFKHIIANTD